jgi:hypothetical protein
VLNRPLLERFDQLFERDIRSRWRIIISSAICVAVIGFISQSAGSSMHEAEIISAAVGSCVFLVQVWSYITATTNVSRGEARSLGVLTLGRASTALLASGLIAIAASISAPIAEAAILNWRLRSAIGPKGSDNRSLLATTKVFVDALALPITLRSDLVMTATDQARSHNTTQAWQAYVAILNYTVNRKLTDDPEALSQTMQRLQSMTDASVCGPANFAMSVMEFTNKNHKTVKVEGLERWPRVIISCRLQLDGQEIKNTILNYVVVRYLGGSMTLDNVKLAGVLFDLPEDNPNVRALADLLLNSQDRVISFKVQ